MTLSAKFFERNNRMAPFSMVMGKAFTESKPANFKDLFVWQKGMAIAQCTYRLTSGFPADEKFGLVAQMRRAAVSIPSNIAEGQARHTTAEFVRFVSIAEGSVAELETQVRLS